MNHHKWLIVFFCLLLLVIPFHESYGQQFYRSEGLELFNQGHFIPAITSMSDWAEQYTSERGIAYFYIAESHYNLGLAADQIENAKSNFEQSIHYFQLAAKQTDLETIYTDKQREAIYKTGWCQLRLAEISGSSGEHFSQASQSFRKLTEAESDSLQMLSYYLMGEANLYLGKLQRIKMFLSGNEGEQINLTNGAREAFQTAISAYQHVVQSSLASIHLRACAAYRLNDSRTGLARLYQNTPRTVIDKVLQGRQESGETLALETFSTIHFMDLLKGLDKQEKIQFSPLAYYGEATESLQLYLLSRDLMHRQKFNQALDSLKWPQFQADKLLMRGMSHHNASMDSEEFIELGNQARSLYARAGRSLPEAWYWLGWVQFIFRDQEALENFQTFLKETSNRPQDARLNYLREDAVYRVLQLQFDHAKSNTKDLQELKKDLEQYQPESSELKIRRDELLRLTRIGLGENIWREILQSPNADSKLTDAFGLIRNMLVRASSVVGKERVPYLNYMDRLFEITQDRKSIETIFYRGLAQFLRAEIQETASSKRDLYLSSSKTLDTNLGIYQQEGQYIQARSIFASAKHVAKVEQRERTYADAKPIFVELINKYHSLRSLYYLAEIFRFQGNDIAAQKCYEVVMEKTKGLADGRFWYQNAHAGLISCQDMGDLSVLKGIAYQDVKFPDHLLVVDGVPISLERFADPAYIRNQLWEESLQLLSKFGLQKKELYYSYYPLPYSVIMPRTFQHVNAGIKERTGSVYSGLKLNLLFPDGVDQEATVRFNGIQIEKDANGFYQKSPIAINDQIEIRVEVPGCYPYVESHLFIQPGMEEVIVPVLNKLSFKAEETILEEGIDLIRFKNRIDNNVILLKGSPPVVESSQIMGDFNSDVNERDFCYSRFLNGHLAVNGNESILSYYRTNGTAMIKSEFPLIFGNDIAPIGSGEGITTDINGQVYVVDWKKHRVLIFDQDGSCVREIGELGENNPAAPGEPAKFVFPRRIALAEDIQGVPYKGRTLYRPAILFVSDRNGVHLLTADGIYLDTISLKNDKQYEDPALAVKGYGNDIRLYIASRKSTRIKRFMVH